MMEVPVRRQRRCDPNTDEDPLNITLHRLALLPLVFALSACARKDQTPEDLMKNFYTDFSAANLEGAASHLGPAMKARFLDKPAVTQAGLAEAKLKVEKCGGLKNLTSFYKYTPAQSTVEGYTLLEYQGSCPAEKQYARVMRHDERWLIEEFGPSVKQ